MPRHFLWQTFLSKLLQFLLLGIYNYIIWLYFPKRVRLYVCQMLATLTIMASSTRFLLFRFCPESLQSIKYCTPCVVICISRNLIWTNFEIILMSNPEANLNLKKISLHITMRFILDWHVKIIFSSRPTYIIENFHFFYIKVSVFKVVCQVSRLVYVRICEVRI